MSHRPQRAAAAQATKANAAALAPRRRSDSQTSIKTITSPTLRHEERPPHEAASSSSMQVMQRASHHDLRRLDPLDVPRDEFGRTYEPAQLSMYWPGDQTGPLMPANHTPSPNHPAQHHHQQHFWDAAPAQPHNLGYPQPLPNHANFELDYAYGGPSNSLGLKDDSGLAIGLNGDLELGGQAAGEPRASDSLDGLALIENLPFQAGSSADNDSYEDSTDSDLPPEKKKLSAAFRPRGRKKRNKCTPDQLRSLEAFFEKNRNPTGRVRLELSRKLRMPERSVQVWFQNRRAKVKTIERRGDTSDSGRKKSYAHRADDKAFRAGAARPRDETTPSVTAIPTSALCIGTWRRVSPLICFFSRRLQSLTWYLTSESIGFKLEIAWTSIRGATFDGPLSPSIAERAEGVRVPLGRLVLDLERPPTFFMEVFRSAPAKNGAADEPKVSWRQCEDFTEDHQAMTVSRHVLNGPYEELRAAVQALARCNEVLERLIVFRDAERRASGDIPTGSGSTADNFGLIHPIGARTIDPLTPPVDAAAEAFGTDVYGHPLPMPMPPAMAAAGSVAKAAPWHQFRTPRGGAEAWEFDSPASVSTNLSEASLDSAGRHLLGYSPYGVASSIEASPRSGLGSSVDLGSLRIDGAAYAGLAPEMRAMGEAMDAGRSASLHGWEGQMAYAMPPMQAETSYALPVSGVMEAGSATSHAMPPPPIEAHFGIEALPHFGGEARHEYAEYRAAEAAETTGASEGLAASRRFSHVDETRGAGEGVRAGARMTSFEEDAFCAQTPTHRTSFAQSTEPRRGSGCDGTNASAGGSVSDEEAALGRARSNTYRPGMHGAQAADVAHSGSDRDADGEEAAEA